MVINRPRFSWQLKLRLIQYKIRFIARQMNVQFRMRALNSYSLLLLLFQPAIFSGIGFALSRIAGQQSPNLVYTVIGGGVMGMWSNLLFTSFYDLTRDRREGTLELIVGSPTSLRIVMMARTLTNVLTGLISMLASFTVAMLWFRYSLSGVNLLQVALSLSLLVLALWCMGLFLANFHAWSRISGSTVNYLEIPVAVICGFMFPIQILPGWMQALSRLIPIRWAILALNNALTGSAEISATYQAWLLASGISLLYLLLALWLGNKVHDDIRVTGELTSV